MAQLENKDEYIDVFPKLKGINKKINTPKPTDPDVDLVLNRQKDINNIFDGEFQKTNEEQTKPNDNQTKNNQNITYFTTRNCVILLLSIIVISLIIYVAYTNLKSNENNTCPKKIPENILYPGQPHQINTQMYPRHPYMYQGHTNGYPGQVPHNPPIQRPQTENLSVHSNTIAKPSKNELLSTLDKIKIETINEEVEQTTENELGNKDSKKSTVNSQPKKKSENNDANEKDNSEQDAKLTKKFYENIQENIDIDAMDDSDENSNEN